MCGPRKLIDLAAIDTFDSEGNHEPNAREPHSKAMRKYDWVVRSEERREPFSMILKQREASAIGVNMLLKMETSRPTADMTKETRRPSQDLLEGIM